MRRTRMFLLTTTLAGACSATGGQPEPAPDPTPRPRVRRTQAAEPRRQAAGPPGQASCGEALERIARAIEGLRDRYPQLTDFSVRRHLDRERLVISYGYHTQRARRRGGWTAAVPNPDGDGVWLHIDFHDPGSTAQIHTQPVVPELRYRDKRVMFLILEGARTRRLGGDLDRILREEGVHPATR